ncbi:XRE family transcriptional regulator [Mycoplana rhizolycopersici]|uniref:Helix-turn-helix domain-containing protein n=1 Tax=Mycoplana rhizolycopersici TaxID=2746702 RepID=A0ABX2Q9T3_9HYPH|nr:XRE family transcriptional regulator [Rhizobium rhizolycopersici]NVP54485.1 helix-turn-helix domain-containing protein [Rhizobium rhizolycopersici]
MGNNLKKLRTQASMTQEDAADQLGVSKSQYVKLERGERRMTADYIGRLAKVFGVRPADILEGAMPDTVPLMGYIGAGAEIMPDFEQVPPEGIEQIHVPFALPDDMVAFRVRGDSMLPVYKSGATVIVYREQKRPLEAFYGEDAAVRTSDGRRFIKTIMKGISGVNLMSWNAAPIENAHLEWIGEIFAVLPGSGLGDLKKTGGIQGRLRLATN